MDGEDRGLDFGFDDIRGSAADGTRFEACRRILLMLDERSEVE